MKSIKVQTFCAGHAIVYTEQLVGSEDTRHVQLLEKSLIYHLQFVYH